MPGPDRSERPPSPDQIPLTPAPTPDSRDSLSTVDEVPGTVSHSLPAPENLLANRYELLEEIAHGGMGTVFRCRDHHLSRDLAVKVMHEHLRDRPDVAHRFLEEAEITGQLQHPGIVPIHERGTLLDGRPFFAMKLVQGRTFAELLKLRTDPSQERQRFLNVFLQVCQAVALAHSKGVIHRDLKPANVMVGEFGEVQVMDWGLAKVFAEPGASATGGGVSPVADAPGSEEVTQAGAVMGTLAYMPPEQACGEVSRLDRRSDVFGLGAILCTVLTGRPPYLGKRDDVLSQAQRGHLGPALARLEKSRADAELIALAQRCLAAERDDRPQDAGEVAQAVAAYLAGVEERARQAEVERARAEVRAAGERRGRRLTLGLAAALLLLVLASGGAAWLVQQQQTQWSQARKDALAVLERAEELLQQGWIGVDATGKPHDMEKLLKAKSECGRAASIAVNGGAGPTVLEQIAAFDTRAGERLQQAQKNRNLLDALLNVASAQETDVYEKADASGRMVALARLNADEQNAAAFQRWYGLDVDRTPEGQVVARLQQEPEPVVQELVAGLDNWMLERRRQKRPEAEWRRLYRLADALDHEDRSQRLRALVAGEALPRAESVAGLLGGGASWLALWNLERDGKWRSLLELKGQVEPSTAPLLTVVLLARASEALGDTRGSEQTLRQALARRPNEPVLWTFLGQLLDRQGPTRKEQALACYGAARALRPELGVAMGKAQRDAGRPAEAEVVMRDLVCQQPDNPEMYFHLGTALGDQKKLDETEAAFREAIELKPDFPETHNNLGVALAEQKKPGEAVAAYRKAIALKPDFPEAHCNLGHVLLRQGRYEQAVTALRRGHELGSRRPQWPYPSADWVKNAERLLALEKKLPALIKGDDKPADVQERLLLTQMCLSKKLYSASARFAAEALEEKPDLSRTPFNGVRYNAACAAVLAAAGKGNDAANLDDKERTRLRQQSLDWLKADLALWDKLGTNPDPKAREAVQQQMQRWRQDADLAGGRDKESLANLPESERDAWTKLWDDIAAVLKKAVQMP